MLTKYAIREMDGREDVYPPKATLLVILQPYSVDKERAFEEACNATRYLAGLGYTVFSPILHTHHYDMYWREKGVEIPGEIYYVWDFDLYTAMFPHLAFVFLEGWKESPGCRLEYRWGKENGVSMYEMVRVPG